MADCKPHTRKSSMPDQPNLPEGVKLYTAYICNKCDRIGWRFNDFTACKPEEHTHHGSHGGPVGLVRIADLPAIRAAAVEEEREWLGKVFEQRIRQAQETTEDHARRGDHEAVMLSRERGRVYRLALEVVDPSHPLLQSLAALDSDSEGERT